MSTYNSLKLLQEPSPSKQVLRFFRFVKSYGIYDGERQLLRARVALQFYKTLRLRCNWYFWFYMRPFFCNEISIQATLQQLFRNSKWMVVQSRYAVVLNTRFLPSSLWSSGFYETFVTANSCCTSRASIESHISKWKRGLSLRLVLKLWYLFYWFS